MKATNKAARFVVTAGLAGALALGGIAPAIPAMAASVKVTSGSMAYTIKGDYKVYQLFTGSFDSTNTHMGDVRANSDYKASVVAVLTENFGFSLDSTMSADRQDIAITDAIEGLKSDTAKAQKFANLLAGKLDSLTPTKTVTAADGKLSVSDLNTGYYLIMGTDSSDAMTSAIVVPVYGDVDATIKASSPTIEKTVQVGSDQTASDFTDIGLIGIKQLDSLKYTLVGTVSSNIDDFASYSYSFVDTLPANLKTTVDVVNTDWGVTVTATIGDQTKTLTGFVASVSDDGNTVTWSCSDLAKVMTDAGLANDHGTAKITLTYSPKFDADAFLEALRASAGDGVAHATNSAKLMYSSNPYDDKKNETADSGTADTARVYTYQLDISKVLKDGESEPSELAGAKFTLEKGETTIFAETEVDEHGKLSFLGLDSGVEYTLIESGTPAGMKSIDPIKFTIEAEKAADGQSIAEVTVDEASTTDPSSAALFGDDNDADNVIHVTVTNIKGADLPLTGQQGIAAGVAVGGVVLAVSLVAVVRNRKQDEK